MPIEQMEFRPHVPFTALEKAFRHLHENGLSASDALQRYESAVALKSFLKGNPDAEFAFLNILRKLDSGILSNEVFFKETEDIVINLHPRYMPVYTHIHHFFELQYVLVGTLRQLVAGHDLVLSAGDVCFIAPETQHAISVFDDDTLVLNALIKVDTFRSAFINLLNANDIISDFFSRVLFCNSFYPYMYCHTAIKDKLDKIVLEMIRVENSAIRGRNRLMTIKLEEFFLYLLDRHECDFVTGSAIGETDKKILPILHYIRDNFRTVTLSETARHFNYSESYLSRIITTYSNNSFSQILRTTRLRNAARLLENTSLPIAAVCVESGYEDRTHFYKAFKEEYGMTPAEYRQAHARAPLE
ncbi:MAG: AraC family transcriptional regulator [Clostridia bacterium]|nr:AraC family transcriptional regulator [Clostridia bacterium]